MKPGMLKSLTVATIAALFIGGSATAIAGAGGISVETSGLKISLDLTSQTGAKVIFQRAD